MLSEIRPKKEIKKLKGYLITLKIESVK